MQKEIKQSIKKIRSKLRRTTEKEEINILRVELQKLKELLKKEPLCS